MTMKSPIANCQSSNENPKFHIPEGNGLFADLSVELLRRGHGVRFRAPGHSMHPTINDRETVTVEPVAPSSVKRGDIVLYRSEGGVVAHRVIRIERNNGTPLFILRGDALGSVDEPVRVQQVLGRVVFVERNGRGINPYGWKSRIFRTAHNCASHLKTRLLRKPL